MNHLSAKLEALLFLYGEPMSVKKIADLLEINEEAARNLVVEFEQKLNSESGGLILISDRDKIQLATRPEYGGFLEKLVKSELSENLTPASLETLSIVSYFGPISRNKIDYLRGVNSAFILRSLLIRGLVERFFDPGHPNVFLYRASFDLLKHLGADKKENLPDYEKFQELLKNFEAGENPGLS